MKKTTRISALILVLALLLNLFSMAYATTEGIRLEDLDVSTYQRLMMESAEAAESRDDSTNADDPLGIGGVCGEDYCLYITEEMVNMTAQEIHEHLNALYYEGLADGEDGPSDAYTILMLHYGVYHQDLGLVCTCGDHPMDAPETFEVGDLSAHTESDCPWKFENLSVEDQYDVICLVSEEEQPAFFAVLRPEQETALQDYIVDMLGSESCEYADVVAMTGYDRYGYMKNLYETTLDSEGYSSWEYIALYSHLANEHESDGLVCNCLEFDIALEDYAYGSVAHTGRELEDGTKAACPWHFNQLPTEEQYKVLMDTHPDNWDEYTVSLGMAQYNALMSYIESMQGGSANDADADVKE